MTSTFLNYQIYARDLPKSLARVAAEPQNAKSQAYFEANIAKVKTVDDFLNDYKLFSYAMKAYGLQDLGNAKAFMKKVLESNLNDSSSFARRLNDSRYTNFAKAFNFTTTGTVASSGTIQTASQQDDLFSRLDLSGSARSSLATTLSGITSVAGLEKDSTTYTTVLSAFGLDAATTPPTDVAAALESDLSNPMSAANRSDTGTSTYHARLRALAADFNFASDGSIGGQTQLQSGSDIAATQDAYLANTPMDTKSQAAAAIESAYYAKTLPTLTSVDQIVANPRLVAVLKTAFGLSASTTTTQLRGILVSNLRDPKSLANTLGSTATRTTAATSAQALALAFNVGTDGQAWDHSAALTSTALASITSAYKTASLAAAGKSTEAVAAATTSAQTETDYFIEQMRSLNSADELMSDPRLVAYVRTAFALPAPVVASDGQVATAGTSVSDLKAILTSNVLDPASAANTKGAAARKLATSFNFAPDGLVYAQRPIQSAIGVTATTTAYQAAAGTTTVDKTAAQAETDYYTSTISRVRSVDDLLADKRLTAYLAKAYNLPATSTSVLRQVLTSNVLDPKSKAATLGGAYQTLAAAFDISADGSITHAADRQVQTKSGIVATHAAYLEQMMESEAETQYGDGVRLALYFRAVAPTITSAYGILSDEALTKVVQTMLGLSSTSSNADIDAQARNITSKLKIADFKDPKKLDSMIARFTSLYDLTNTSTSTSSVTSLFA